MISGLPSDFIAKTQSKNRKPVQLCHFHFRGKTYLLSDSPVGTVDGLMYDYDPIIESWGTIKDTLNLDQSFSGNSLEIKSTSLSIIITSEYKDLLQDAFTYGLDNSVVELYQWFKDLPNEAPVLMDIMVAQDPIVYSENSSVFQVDLVSMLMRNNPFLWAREPGEETRDIVVGKVSNMPLYDQQTSRTTTIEQDIEYDYLGQMFIGNGVGFNAGPDKLTIDSEIVSYDWISASAVNITARGVDSTTARPHIRGALICHPDAVFDYSICAGPVALIDNLEGNGEPYTQPVTFFPGQDPAIARFIGRPPWLKVSPGIGGTPIIPDPETSTEYGAATKSTYGGGAGAASSPSSINSASGSASMAISHTVAGGAGSFSKTKNSPNSTNNLSTSSSATPLDMLYTASTSQLGYQFGSYRSYKKINDGVIGWKQQTYGDLDTAYDNLTGLTIDVYLGVCRVKRGKGTIKILFVRSSGATVTLLTETAEKHDAFPKYFDISDSTLNFDVGSYVSSFAELEDCGVRVEYTNDTKDNATISEGGEADFNQVRWNISYFIDAGSVPTPWQQLLSDFNRDLSSLGALTSIECKVRFGTSVSNATVERKVIFNGSTLWNDSISSSSGIATVTINPSISSFAELQAAEIGVYQRITAPETEGTTRQSTTTFEYVQWIITYQPGAIETPDEERVVYADDLVCDVTSNLGENPTPAKVIRHLLEDHSSNGIYINNNSFNSRHDEYEADSYYFNGVLKGDIRLHDAIRQCLREGMARLLFSQGSIGLLNYSVYENPSIDYTIGEDEILLRSKATKNQPTSTIKNDVTIMYKLNPAEGEYEGKEQQTNIDSIAKFERQEYRGEYSLIQSDAIALKIATYVLDRLDEPTTVALFDMFMPAYRLEKGDRIQFPTSFTGVNAIGHVASVDRIMGQGKSNQMNKFSFSIADLELI